MHAADDFVPKPWYRQFWPWFLISIPAATVVASIATIKFAIDSSDGLVSENYYKEGLAIYRDADALLKAREFGIRANIVVSPDSRALAVDLRSKANQAFGPLQLSLRHPTRARHDIRLALQATGPGHYEAMLPQDLADANWVVELSAPEAGWRLHGRMDIKNQKEMLLR